MTDAKLIVLRHGQTEDNLRGILTGQSDTALSKLGEKQAHFAGYLLHGIPLHKVYSSTLSRAFHTAALALNTADHHHMPIEKRPEIVETDLGDFTRLHQDDPVVAAFDQPFEKPLPGGESLKDVVERVRHFYEDEILPRLKRGENVLVVAHAGVVSAFGIALGARDSSAPRRDVANATPVVYEYKHGEQTGSYLIENPVSIRRDPKNDKKAGKSAPRP